MEEKNPLPPSKTTLNTSISKDLVEVEEKLQFFSRVRPAQGVAQRSGARLCRFAGRRTLCNVAI